MNKDMTTKNIACTVLLLISFTYSAQTDSTKLVTSKNDSIQTKDPKKLMVSALPVISSGPTTGFMFGATASLAKYMGDSDKTHMSMASFGIIYTLKKQLFITFKSTVYLKNDSWLLQGDWRYLKNILPNWGLGTGPQSAKLASSNGFEYSDNMWSNPIVKNQELGFNHIRFHEVVMKQIKNSHVFIGGGYRLDIHQKIKDNTLRLDTVPPTITAHYAYSTANGFNPERYVLSSLSIDATYDTRDVSSNPYKGRYANASFRFSPTFLGSSKNSSNLWVEYRDYVSLSNKNPRHLIGFWAFGQFETSGKHGYLDLPATGFDQYSRSARPYTQGRFRGQNLVYLETECRFPIWRSWGGVVYVNGSTVSNHDADINLFTYLDPGYGVGLRWMMNKKARTNICIEYGFGKYGASGFMLNLTETF
jgi:hypothetical protein